MSQEPKNLMDGLFSEMERVRELRKMYESIGQAGAFGVVMLNQALELAEQSIKENDVVKMLQAYQALKECQ